MGLTTDPNDPRLHHGVDNKPGEQHDTYLVLPPLSEDEKRRGFVRPVRQSYKHKVCGTVTKMGTALAETYARDPKFYGSTYCCACQMHKPVSEFVWDGTEDAVGS